MQFRFTGPALSVPGVAEAFQAPGASASQAGLPPPATHLVHLRVREVNGCAVRLGIHARAPGYNGRLAGLRNHQPDAA